MMIFYNNHHQEICTYALAHTGSTSLCIIDDVEVFAMQQIILFIRDCTYDFAHNGSNKSVYI